ncbi:enoyl-CoA hydratase/carnithine racemase [Bacillus iocasae]|uniref:Enoyl-CoA hydratase/carnithine racemase n=2 Tax=Priestia iocasae TaxID=2291674 RepID=A0ABS2QTH6_9BACI|nr:enoyl-CoA hydratase [Metabacillus iocasae]MBM7702695.1 enoyl-CoA hydratase/carnithine racemase [Metabacillus iocasae]
MTVETKIVEVSYEERVAILTLNRPDSLNSLNMEMLTQFVQCLKDVRDSEADFLVLKGNGKAFSAGGDIKMMLSSDSHESFDKVMDVIGELITTLYTLPQMTISALHGAVAGLGLSIALASDYILAEKQTKVAMNFIGIALIPDGAGHFLLEKRLGAHKAKQIIWKGDVLTADQAQALELVDEVIEGDMKEAVNNTLAYWKQKPALALKETKNIYVKSSLAELQSILEMEKAGQSKMRKSADHLEGIQAFIEKRKPIFNKK